MQLPTLDFHTAFGMTALSGWSLVGLLWLVGRNFPRQGVAWVMASVFMFGTGYFFMALATTLPTVPAMVTAYVCIGFGSSLVAVGINRFRRKPWGWQDGLLLAIPVVFPLLWTAIAGPNFLLRARLSNSGFLVQMALLSLLLWRTRLLVTGHGWKVMLIAVLVQVLSVLPLALMGRPPSPAGNVSLSLTAQLIPWVICIVMFLNLQVSVLAFLMMLQDRRNDEERQAAEIDVLTQLPNRRSLERQMLAALPLVYRQGGSVAIVLLDIDHFKQVNDNYGHDVGDQVLQHVAGLLRAEVRQGELLARYGGEEFVIILPYANVDAASTLAARVVDKVRKAPIAIQGELHTMTVSAGVHVQRLAPGQRQLPATAQWPDWVRAADGAMYEAKHAGRNRFVVSQTSHQ